MTIILDWNKKLDTESCLWGNFFLFAAKIDIHILQFAVVLIIQARVQNLMQNIYLEREFHSYEYKLTKFFEIFS